MVRYRRAVWWVKRDFRLDDNAALLAAASSDRLLAVFIYDPERLHAPETSAVHLEVWRRGGESLARGLRERGGEIAALHGSLPEAFERLRSVYPFDAIICHADPDGPEGAVRDARVAAWCARRGVDFAAFPSVSADDAHWKELSATAPDPLPVRLPDPGIVMLPTWRHWPLPAALGFSDPVPNVDAEPDAVAALERFLSLDGGPSSGISGALAWGALGTRRTVRLAQARLAEWRPSTDPFVCRRADAVRAFLARLHRRERSRRAAMERPERLDRVEGLPGRDDPRTPDPRLLAAWADGETGFPHADAAMRCLRATGLLPFRFRAHLASVATRVLGLPWQSIRPHFARAFADYDPAILSLQLQVRAGLAGGPAPAAPIVPPRDLDPEAAFVKTWLPELRRYPASEIAMHGLRPIPAYRRPVVDPRTASAHADADLRRQGVDIRATHARRPSLASQQAALVF